MSTQLSRVRIYTEQEFKAASRVERIGMHLIQEKLMLSPSDEAYKSELWSIFNIQCSSFSQLEIIRKVKDLYPRKKMATVRRMITDAESVFGSLLKRNKDVSRAVRIERLSKIHEMAVNGVFVEEVVMIDGQEVKANKCLIEPNLKVAVDAIKIIDKIESEIKDDQKMIDELTIGDIIFTNDPDALIEDVDHEEVSEEE